MRKGRLNKKASCMVEEDRELLIREAICFGFKRVGVMGGMGSLERERGVERKIC